MNDKSKEDEENNKIYETLSKKYSINQNAEAENNKQSSTKSLVTKNEEKQGNILVIGITYALGIDPSVIVNALEKELTNKQKKDEKDKKNYHFDYESIDKFRISDFLQVFVELPVYQKQDKNEFESDLMHAGTCLAKEYGSHALMEIAIHYFKRNKHTCKNLTLLGLKKKNILCIYSMKRPEEVEYLKEIFGVHFIMVGVYQEEDKRLRQYIERDLNKDKSEYRKYEIDIKNEKENKEIKTPEDWAKGVFKTDQDQESSDNGQKLAETFALADFVMEMASTEILQTQWQRLLKIIFGYPFVTPTFDELAMHVAYSMSLKSSDLSRQVGAVITKDQQILATGANDPPRFGGGCYWPEQQHLEIYDAPKGRDYIRCKNSNQEKVNELTARILKALYEDSKNSKNSKNSNKIKKILNSEISEFGRAVHAEMDALCAAARSGISVKGATLYTTTFPCHNCAKHLLAAGIERVVFMQPYPKSEALNLHDDALYLRGVGCSESSDKMRLEHFMGLSSRAFERYFQLKSPGLIGNFDRKNTFDQLNKRSECTMRLEEVNKTLQYSIDEPDREEYKNDSEDEPDPEAKHSQCASQYFYREWLQTKPTLRYRELAAVLNARIQAWLDEK